MISTRELKAFNRAIKSLSRLNNIITNIADPPHRLWNYWIWWSNYFPI